LKLSLTGYLTLQSIIIFGLHDSTKLLFIIEISEPILILRRFTNFVFIIKIFHVILNSIFPEKTLVYVTVIRTKINTSIIKILFLVEEEYFLKERRLAQQLS